MHDFNFRLNPYTFVRKFSGYFYLENQISHVHAKLPADEFKWLSTVSYGSTYNLGQLYNDMSSYLGVTDTLLQLHEAWLIDIENQPMSMERRFSYANKREIERRFEDFHEIIFLKINHTPCSADTIVWRHGFI